MGVEKRIGGLMSRRCESISSGSDQDFDGIQGKGIGGSL
jgi:hypothetical protein